MKSKDRNLQNYEEYDVGTDYILEKITKCEDVFYHKTKVNKDWNYRKPSERRSGKPRQMPLYLENKLGFEE